jgi:hypothetical protein
MTIRNITPNPLKIKSNDFIFGVARERVVLYPQSPYRASLGVIHIQDLRSSQTQDFIGEPSLGGWG